MNLQSLSALPLLATRSCKHNDLFFFCWSAGHFTSWVDLKMVMLHQLPQGGQANRTYSNARHAKMEHQTDLHNVGGDCRHPQVDQQPISFRYL
jgi:hypothetical protein